MSAVVTTAPRRSFAGTHALSAGTTAVVVAGCVLLAARAWLPPTDGVARPLTGIVLFGAILVASVAVREPRRRDAPISAPIALVVGFAGIGAAAALGGTPAGFPAAAWTLPLSVLAAIAEEALFRKVAYGALARLGVPAAVIGSAVLFAIVHVPLYGVAVLPVDLGAGLVFGWQRWATGSWTVPAATHATANLVAVLR